MPRALRAVSTDEKAQLQAQVKAEAPRPVDVFIDEKELLAKSTFPIKPDELIELAKKALDDDTGLSKNPSWVDQENFGFESPFVGPYGYDKLIKALSSYDMRAVFPAYFTCYYNFWVDPYEPSRVWYTTRSFDGTPVMQSLKFNEQGKIVRCTVAYPMDRSLGNTGGIGGFFGFFYAIGKGLPFPEAQPYKMSWQLKMFNVINSITSLSKGE